MGNIFSGSEIVELGIQIENNGRDFYNTLFAQSKNPRARDIFKFLAQEEEKHIQVFRKILDSLEGYQPAESYPGEYFAYMSALAGDYVFTQKNRGSQMAKNVASEEQAVNLGIGFEKDSIIFYEGMKKAVPDFEIKVVDELITQEQSHLRMLAELRQNIKG